MNVRPIAAAVATTIAALVLTACASSDVETPTAPAASVSDQEAEQIVAVQEATAKAALTAAEQVAHDTAVRVAKGECFSDMYGSTAGKLGQAYAALPLVDAPTALRVSAAEAMLATVPADDMACDDTDRQQFDFYRSNIANYIADAQASTD